MNQEKNNLFHKKTGMSKKTIGLQRNVPVSNQCQTLYRKQGEKNQIHTTAQAMEKYLIMNDADLLQCKGRFRTIILNQ